MMAFIRQMTYAHNAALSSAAFAQLQHSVFFDQIDPVYRGCL